MRHAWIVAALIAAPAAAQEAGLENLGAQIFANHCATCHGIEGKGDGPMQEVLVIEVPDLTTLSERAGGAFPHYQVVAQIDGRDPLLSHGMVMPVWGPIFEGDQAFFVRTNAGQPIVTSEPIAALVTWLETVQE